MDRRLVVVEEEARDEVALSETTMRLFEGPKDDWYAGRAGGPESPVVVGGTPETDA